MNLPPVLVGTSSNTPVIMLRIYFHAGVLLFNTFSFWYDQTYVDLPFPDNLRAADLIFKARFIFLTHWCFILQTIYYLVALLNDLIGTNKPWPKTTPWIRKAKDSLFIIAFPLATYVTSTFWSLYAIDRELIFPKAFDPIFPSWLNHSLHSFVFLFILIELITSFRKYPSKSVGYSLGAVFMITYIAWVNLIYFRYGIWVYPILEVMNWFGRIAFYVFSTSIVIGFYALGEKFNSDVWKKELSKKKF